MEIRKLSWNGSSLVLPIPPHYAAAAGIERHAHVEIFLNEDKTLTIRKLQTKPHQPAKGEER